MREKQGANLFSFSLYLTWDLILHFYYYLLLFIIFLLSWYIVARAGYKVLVELCANWPQAPDTGGVLKFFYDHNIYCDMTLKITPCYPPTQL